MTLPSPYTTKDFDVLDALCYQYYGFTTGTVEAVYEANRDLASLGVVLPRGTTITFPPLAPPATTTEVIRLWD